MENLVDLLFQLLSSTLIKSLSIMPISYKTTLISFCSITCSGLFKGFNTRMHVCMCWFTNNHSSRILMCNHHVLVVKSYVQVLSWASFKYTNLHALKEMEVSILPGFQL